MFCPECKKTIDDGSWFCPHCAAQLKSDDALDDATANVNAADDDRVDLLDHDTITQEVTSSLAWQHDQDAGRSHDALIVGDLSDPGYSVLDVDTMSGAVPREDGSMSTFLLYTDRASKDALGSGAVLRKKSDAGGASLTPYEQFLMESIDGTRTVGEIQEEGLLNPSEILVSLLTLLDRKLIEVVEAPKQEAPKPKDPTPAPPPMLDPAMLVELSPVKPLPAVPAKLPPPAKAPGLPAPSAKAKPAAPAAPPPRPAPRAAAVPQKKGGSREQLKAKELYDAALRDRASGNVIAARMNLKLAIAFDPQNVEYAQLFAELGAIKPGKQAPARAIHSAAQKLFDDAAREEANGNVDEAVQMLERALRYSRDPMILNRLGVILATKKREFKRAQDLLEQATREDPKNEAYAHNLSKVLGLAAASELEASSGPAKKKPGGFWERLTKRKS